MAKSSRSSVQKRNKAKLRATVFGPAADARTERLSAKLQELASQPRPRTSDTAGMDLDTSADTQGDGAVEIKAQRSDEDMDVDGVAALATRGNGTEKSGRVRKRGRTKSQSSMVFLKHPQKTKRISKRK